MNERHILLVEDDPELGRQVRDSLVGAGFSVDWEQNGKGAQAREVDRYALVILDLMLPEVYGLDILKVFRRDHDVPILIMSARSDGADIVRALKLGADDYITKPFWPQELLARVEARLRRPNLTNEKPLESCGDLFVDIANRQARIGSLALSFTPTEFRILEILLARRGQAISRYDLVEEALEQDRAGADRALDVHISRMRKKLKDSNAKIDTVWGVGYRLIAEDS